MKIEIKCNETKLWLTNDMMNNDNFVDMWYGEGADEITVPIDELYSAVLAFKNLKNERKEV